MAIKLRIALKLELLHATIVVEKVTFPVIVLKRPKPSLATSAARKVIFLVIALSNPTMVVVVDSLVPKNATAAARQVTLLVSALKVQGVVVVAVVVDTTPLVTTAKGHATLAVA